MQLVLHTGVHFTEEDRLMKCLLRNRSDFAQRGVSIPGPGKYRVLLRQTLDAMIDAPLAYNARDLILDDVLDDERPSRVILSNPHFFGAPRTALRRGVLYPNAPMRLSQLAQLFAADQIELFMAIRNPATFLPAAFEQSPRESVLDFMGGVDPRVIRWSDSLIRMREAAPEIPITVWCNEDSPLIWAQIIRDMAGLDHGQKIIGGFDLLSDIIAKEGMQRFRAYLKKRPDMSEMQKRQVIAAFMDKFAVDAAIEEEIDMPGWTDDIIDELTAAYDEDMHTIKRIPGVQILSP
jgi:hypothetical protein